LTLCGSGGYIEDALPLSRSDKSNLIKLKPNLNITESAITQLATRLPKTNDDLCHVIFMDNLFSSPRLFAHLRTLGIGAVGTVRQKLVPKDTLDEISSRRGSISWGDEIITRLDGQVLLLSWFDHGWVHLATTVHDGEEHVSTHRKRSRSTSSGAAVARRHFDQAQERLSSIPAIIDDYNCNKSFVDLSDQLRAYYTCLMRSRRNWIAMFLFLLELALTNSHCLFNSISKQPMPSIDFRLSIIRSLTAHPTIVHAPEPVPRLLEQPPDPPRSRASKGKPVTLPAERFNEGDHIAIKAKKTRRRCYYCRHAGEKGSKAPKTVYRCSNCGYFLCNNSKRACFDVFHSV